MIPQELYQNLQLERAHVRHRWETTHAPSVTSNRTELTRFLAIEDNTRKHPVLVSDLLLVRNAQEMVEFRLSLAGR